MTVVRTTVTLDSDTEALVRRRMKERGVSFKQALNDAIREGSVGRRAPRRFETQTADLGMPVINLDRAIQVAADLEDEELVRKSRAGK